MIPTFATILPLEKLVDHTKGVLCLPCHLVGIFYKKAFLRGSCRAGNLHRRCVNKFNSIFFFSAQYCFIKRRGHSGPACGLTCWSNSGKKMFSNEKIEKRVNKNSLYKFGESFVFLGLKRWSWRQHLPDSLTLEIYLFWNHLVHRMGSGGFLIQKWKKVKYFKYISVHMKVLFVTNWLT